MQILVDTGHINGLSMPVELTGLEPTTSIEELKAIIRDKTAIPPEEQRVVFAAKTLEVGKGRVIADYNVQDGATLALLPVSILGGTVDGSVQPGMEVDAGPLAGVYDTIICLSDFEADDLLCLRMLASRCADVPMRMVVGEGDQDKSSLASHVLGKYGFKGALTLPACIGC